jgi:hypothetical protein
MAALLLLVAARPRYDAFQDHSVLGILVEFLKRRSHPTPRESIAVVLVG